MSSCSIPCVTDYYPINILYHMEWFMCVSKLYLLVSAKRINVCNMCKRLKVEVWNYSKGKMLKLCIHENPAEVEIMKRKRKTFMSTQPTMQTNIGFQVSTISVREQGESIFFKQAGKAGGCASWTSVRGRHASCGQICPIKNFRML